MKLLYRHNVEAIEKDKELLPRSILEMIKIIPGHNWILCQGRLYSRLDSIGYLY
jgi:hypothetical protein